MTNKTKFVETSTTEFHNAKAILDKKGVEKDLIESIASLKQLGRNVRPTPSRVIQAELKKRGWKTEEPIYTTKKTKESLDAYHSSKIGVEVEMTDPNDLLRVLIKMQLAYIYDQIDAGVIITYDDSVKGDNLPHAKTAIKWYEDLKMFVNFPLFIIGLKPKQTPEDVR
jgi:hypothetical protein